MKPSLILSNGLVFSLVFFPFCKSLENQTGSISRQLDLIEDLENKLPESERPRFRKALLNLREESKIKDDSINAYRKEAKDSIETTLESKEDAGKWYGLRNLAIFAGIGFAIFTALKLTGKI
jgi:hypothetical protein